VAESSLEVMVAKKVEPERLVFVDEMGANTSLSVMRAWSRTGERVYCSVPSNLGKNTNLLASMGARGMGARGMGPTLAVEGATDREVFEAYVEEVLTQSLRSGQIVVTDNLTAHKGERVRELIEERGCELLYLPPYSPDLNPIEEAFSKIKGILRKAEDRSREALIEAMAARSMRSPLRMRKTSSLGADTYHGGNHCDHRCGLPPTEVWSFWLNNSEI
jgi:transposase